MTADSAESSGRHSDFASVGSPQTLATSPTSSSTPTTPIVSPDVRDLPEDDTETKEELVELLQSMNLNVKHTHFIGKSSSLVFVRAAVALKREFASAVSDPNFDHSRRDKLITRQPEFWDDMAVSNVNPMRFVR